MKEEVPEKTKMLMQLLYSRLSEKDRRHYAAMESLKFGHGGTTYISKVLGVDRSTIIRGRKELKALMETEETPVSQGKQRQAGGGRKKKR